MNENILERLQQPLDPGRVRQRKGPGGKSLAYLEGHDVISTANDLFGFEWSSQLVGAVEHVATAPRYKTVWSKRERRRVPVKDEKDYLIIFMIFGIIRYMAKLYIKKQR